LFTALAFLTSVAEPGATPLELYDQAHGMYPVLLGSTYGGTLGGEHHCHAGAARPWTIFINHYGFYHYHKEPVQLVGFQITYLYSVIYIGRSGFLGYVLRRKNHVLDRKTGPSYDQAHTVYDEAHAGETDFTIRHMRRGGFLRSST
jgi:hypothetical protein